MPNKAEKLQIDDRHITIKAVVRGGGKYHVRSGHESLDLNWYEDLHLQLVR